MIFLKYGIFSICLTGNGSSGFYHPMTKNVKILLENHFKRYLFYFQMKIQVVIHVKNNKWVLNFTLSHILKCFFSFSHGQYGGWDEMDHTYFVIIYDQYPHDLANRRMLIIDRIKRQVPGKTRADIVSLVQSSVICLSL